MSLAFSHCRCYECEINNYITELGEHDSRDAFLIVDEKDNEYMEKYVVDDIDDDSVDYTELYLKEYWYMEYLSCQNIKISSNKYKSQFVVSDVYIPDIYDIYSDGKKFDQRHIIQIK
jgi:hypothetical protein